MWVVAGRFIYIPPKWKRYGMWVWDKDRIELEIILIFYYPFDTNNYTVLLLPNYVCLPLCMLFFVFI